MEGGQRQRRQVQGGTEEKGLQQRCICTSTIRQRCTSYNRPCYIQYFSIVQLIRLVLRCQRECRNLPFGRRATRGSRVRLPRKENARSRHQRLFEENVGKTGKGVIYEKCERFGSCFNARGRYQHPTRPSQGTATFSQMCKYDFNLFYFPFLCLFTPFYIFIFLWSTRVFPFAPTYSSIWDEKIRPTQFFRNKVFG